jgi:hypothetical protein
MGLFITFEGNAWKPEGFRIMIKPGAIFWRIPWHTQ